MGAVMVRGALVMAMLVVSILVAVAVAVVVVVDWEALEAQA
jgi:hypothetical protein